MDDDRLIEKLEEGVREAEELLRRRKQALAALKGKVAGSGKRGGSVRGLRPGSLPALAQAALKAFKQPVLVEDLVIQLKRTNPSLTALDARKLSIALSRYVREGKYFVVGQDGKYGLK
jgi:hypothetical protein